MKLKLQATCMIEMVGAGAIHLDDCPVRTFIPLYLVVNGSVYTFCSLMCIMQIVFLATDSENAARIWMIVCCMCLVIYTVIGTFTGGFYITGK